MNIIEIADKMAKTFHIDGLESKNGTLEMEIDGAYVRIEETDGDVFMLYGLVGNAPTEGGEIFAAIALEGNLSLIRSKAATLTRSQQSGAYVLVERMPNACTSDFESFCTTLGDFVNTLDVWRTLLQDFTPAQTQAATVAAEKKAESDSALRNGFLIA